MKKEQTKVIFRKFTGDGSIIAQFPELPADVHAGHCLSYQHIGQHGAASIDLAHVTVPAKPAEYARLKAELEAIGYNLETVKRATAAMHAARCAKIRR
jgi:hypothetical protein